MIEIASDAPVWEEYESEQERARRHRRNQQLAYEWAENLIGEKEIEDYEFI